MQGDERRHVAILDGTRRFDLALTPRATLADALAGLGVGADGATRVLVGRDGRKCDTDVPGEQLDDGAVLTLVDPLEQPPQREPAARGESAEGGAQHPATGWILTVFGLLLATVALLVPDAIEPAQRIALAAIAAAGAIAAAVLRAVRSRSRTEPVASAVGSLSLAFAAGVVAVPTLPAAGGVTAVFTGFAFAGVLAALLTVLTANPVPRARLSVAAVILLSLAALWGVAILLDAPSSAACAVALGAAPVVIRAVPGFLLEVPPGLFIDYPRFQSTRWSVRQNVPQPVTTVPEDAVRRLVERSATRLSSATILVSAMAAATAPWALGSFSTPDPLVLGGRIGLACCATVSLVLGARRSSNVALRWTPRAAALVVAVVALASAARSIGPLGLVLGAGGALAAGIVAAFVVAPVARGAHSLFWSRLSDIIDTLAVVLALPAGLLAAGAIDILRGVLA